MPKTIAPGRIKITGEPISFIANALPDPFDERDLEYRPRIQPLPPLLDQRGVHKKNLIVKQKGNSCTGHAVAAVINTVLAQVPLADSNQLPDRVSAYMLYHLARRYDEFPGNDDLGSSLRGVLKGWYHHGLALEVDWNEKTDPEPNLDDLAFVGKCRDRPLGAYYRVNPYRLDDMQSSITELNAVAVSAVIHDGWINPVRMVHSVQGQADQEIYLIRREVNAKLLGGHAFAIVGYNQVGFLVLNSWGTKWGKGGYATLAYEDWLDSVYDAWVVRPGVPQTPFASGRSTTARVTGDKLATGPGLDIARLDYHVVNLANEGLLSTHGKAMTTPTKIDALFNRMDEWHTQWIERQATEKRYIVLYAHGGLVGEKDGLATAQKHLNWWINNHVYPLYFVWQSGPGETFVNQLADLLRGRLPAGGIGFDLVEQFDRLVERISRVTFTGLWDEMKENAAAASKPLKQASQIHWPPISTQNENLMAKMPGASLTVNRLLKYIKSHGKNNVQVHLVGHSAGTIFHAYLLERLAEAGISVESANFMAAALRVDDFQKHVLPNMGAGKTISRFMNIALNNPRELDDALPPTGLAVYHKSLLYLIARALERPRNQSQKYEVPLLGMEKFFEEPISGNSPNTLHQEILAHNGVAVFAPSRTADDASSDAHCHGCFNDDSLSMTSVLLNILGLNQAQGRHTYQGNAPLLEDQPMAAGASADEAREVALRSGSRGGEEVEITNSVHAVATSIPGEVPLVTSAEMQTGTPKAPPMSLRLQNEPIPEVAVAPNSGSPTVDILQSLGWVEIKDK